MRLIRLGDVGRAVVAPSLKTAGESPPLRPQDPRPHVERVSRGKRGPKK